MTQLEIPIANSAQASAHSCVFSVVLADDDDKVRAALAGLIEDHASFALVGAVADGLAAADLCRSTTPDLVLVDVMMPTGGSDAAVAIHAVSPSTVVCAYTARGDRRTRDQLLAGGIEAVFVKGRSEDLAGRLFDLMSRRNDRS